MNSHQDNQLTTVLGQPSWSLSSTTVAAHITQIGGHVGPVTFILDGNTISPFSVAPWAEEEVDPTTPPLLRSLRGDFFCLPFGNNEMPYRGEEHPYHGETANNAWTFGGIQSEAGRHTLHLTMNTTIRAGHVDKYITLRDGHAAIYSQHIVSGMEGPMDLGHHAMLKFPDEPGSGVLSTSHFVYGQVLPFPCEQPELKGYSILKPGASFDSLSSVPTITGETTDLSRYPSRRGFEDLALIVSDTNVPFAWTAVTFAKEGYVWFALKDPQILRSTMFWLSNGGRHYAPWSSRHINVMGLEEITSNFHCGLAESAAPNPLSEKGYPTSLTLDPKNPLVVNYIMAVAAVPAGFDSVAEITASADNSSVTLRSASGQSVNVKLDVGFLQSRAK